LEDEHHSSRRPSSRRGPARPALFACSEPADETPLGREAAALLARPEQNVQKVTLQHVRLAFVGAMRGSASSAA